MAPLVTNTELIVWLDIADDTFPTDRATLLVNSASAAIRSYCGWNISQETLTDEIVDGSGRWDLWLPTKHLTAVAEIEEEGVLLVHPDDYVWYRSGRITHVRRWTPEAKGVQITYTHGYPTGHPKLDLARTVCLTAAGRMVTNPGGLQSETIGAVSWTMAGGGEEATVVLTKGDQNMLEPLALSGVA